MSSSTSSSFISCFLRISSIFKLSGFMIFVFYQLYLLCIYFSTPFSPSSTFFTVIIFPVILAEDPDSLNWLPYETFYKGAFMFFLSPGLAELNAYYSEGSSSVLFLLILLNYFSKSSIISFKVSIYCSICLYLTEV